MSQQSAEVVTEGNECLRREIESLVGSSVRFSNGCWLNLKDDGGLFWGDDPYVQAWACNVTDDWLETVLNWIAFWDEPRTESKELM